MLHGVCELQADPRISNTYSPLGVCRTSNAYCQGPSVIDRLPTVMVATGLEAYATVKVVGPGKRTAAFAIRYVNRRTRGGTLEVKPNIRFLISSSLSSVNDCLRGFGFPPILAACNIVAETIVGQCMECGRDHRGRFGKGSLYAVLYAVSDPCVARAFMLPGQQASPNGHKTLASITRRPVPQTATHIDAPAACHGDASARRSDEQSPYCVHFKTRNDTQRASADCNMARALPLTH